MKSAQSAGLYLVSLNWLLESIEAGKVLAEKDYIFDAAVAPASAPSGPSTTRSNAPAAPRVGTRVSKRTASNLKDMVIESDEEKEKPPIKKTRGAAKGKVVDEVKVVDKMDVDEDEEEEEKPAPKKAGVVKGKKEKVEEKKADPKPVAAKGKAKGKGKAVAKVTPKDDEEEEEEEKEVKKEEVKPKMKTIIKKGKAPVDEFCPNRGRLPLIHSNYSMMHRYLWIFALTDSLHVFVDAAGTVYDATLNQTDIGANNNKFYYCQVCCFRSSIDTKKSLV